MRFRCLPDNPLVVAHGGTTNGGNGSHGICRFIGAPRRQVGNIRPTESHSVTIQWKADRPLELLRLLGERSERGMKIQQLCRALAIPEGSRRFQRKQRRSVRQEGLFIAIKRMPEDPIVLEVQRLDLATLAAIHILAGEVL